MPGIPICISNYFPGCILPKRSLMPWHKSPLFIFTLSDGSISEILKTITKRKQNIIPKAEGLTLEGSLSSRSSFGRHTTLRRGLQPAPQEPRQGSPWAEAQNPKGRLVKPLLPSLCWFPDSHERQPFLLVRASQSQSFSPQATQLLPCLYFTCAASY